MFKIKHIIIFGMLVFFVSLFFSCTAQGQDESKKLVTDVRVTNNNVISTQTILSKIKSRPGSVFSQELVNEDLKRLYATDYFTDVSVDVGEFENGFAITFIVTEKPVLSEIIFEGNKTLNAERLKSLLTIKKGESLDMRVLKNDLDNIENFYQKKGFHQAKIDYETDVNEITNEATLYILIKENIRYRIAGIFVKGNEHIPAKEILKSMKTKKDTLLTAGFFRKEIFEKDLRRVELLYLAKGFSDVKIEPDLEYMQEKKQMKITLLIDEGNQYRVGTVKIGGNKKFTTEEIMKTLELPAEATFSQSSLEKDASNISAFYFEKGYIFAQVKPEAAFNETSQKIDISYLIEEGELAYVDKVIIRGNTKTKDVVIRRELRVLPGEAFDGEKLQRSKERLYRLGFFEEVTYDIEPGSASDRKNLVVNVKETKTGEFSFGAGYSSTDKVLGFVQITQRNFDITNPPYFTGDGQELTVKANLGSERKDYLLSFTEPWILDYPLSFGFDVYNTFRGTWEDFDVGRTGGDIRFAKEFTEYTRANLMYKLEEVNISNISSDVSADVLAESGKKSISQLEFGLRNDTRDNVYFPGKGHILTGTVDYAGTFLGGDKDYLKIEGEGRQYFTQFKNLVLELRLAAGFAEELDDSENVPIYEKFYLGGPDTIRGYKLRHVGPKDSAGHPLGGKAMLLASAEYTFPIMAHLKGAVFCDAGNVWEEWDNFGDGIKSSIGLGLRIKTPLGPVKLDYGYGLNYDEGEEKGKFHFNMSREF